VTNTEKERAMLSDKKEFPQDMPCAVCGYRWMQHHGILCPKTPGYFNHVLQTAVPPTMGDTTFIPDVDYYKTPDFDVV
jgi:hypothetical protein